jgi:putative cardiolipin synthase
MTCEGNLFFMDHFDDDGSLYWQNSDETVTEQPARDGMQRVMNVLMKLGPVEQF